MVPFYRSIGRRAGVPTRVCCGSTSPVSSAGRRGQLCQVHRLVGPISTGTGRSLEQEARGRRVVVTHASTHASSFPCLTAVARVGRACSPGSHVARYGVEAPGPPFQTERDPQDADRADQRCQQREYCDQLVRHGCHPITPSRLPRLLSGAVIGSSRTATGCRGTVSDHATTAATFQCHPGPNGGRNGGGHPHVECQVTCCQYPTQPVWWRDRASSVTRRRTPGVRKSDGRGAAEVWPEAA